MKNTNMLKSVLAILCLMFIVSACEDGQMEPLPEKSGVFNSQQANDLAKKLDILSQAFAKLLADPEIRSLIREVLSMEVTQAYEFPYKDLKDMELSDGTTIESRLLKALEHKVVNAKFWLSELTLLNANLQISMPVHFEDWNSKSYIPSITPFIPQMEKVWPERIIAYQANGGQQIFAKSVEPTVPVMVIGPGERLDLEGNVKKEYRRDDELAVSRGLNTDTLVTECFIRQNGAPEIMSRFRIPDLRGVEGWLAGPLELRIYATSILQDSLGNYYSRRFAEFYYPNVRRRELRRGGWKVINQPILARWIWERYGEEILYSWVEEDGGVFATVDFEVGIDSLIEVSVTIPIQDQDENCGSALVNRLDPRDYIYSTGTVDFQMTFECLKIPTEH